MFKQTVTSEKELRDLMGTPSERAIKKESPFIDERSREFIAHAPFLLLATSDATGRCDVSPKGDAPGFVQVLDDHHLVIPDRPGNKRLDGMRNILENPHVGLIFLVPERGETLRVNGRAAITRDPELLARMEVGGKRPLLAIGVEVEEVFLHCAKAFKRSGLWEPGRWPDLAALPSSARMFRDHMGADMSVEEMARRIDEGYRTRVY